ncbi:MAG: RnfABCDGE type electron transport complex subunit D, partial [Oscillospiraceae bacterium]
MNNLNELKTKYINMIVTLLTVIAMAAFLHGPKVIELILVAVFTAVVVDFIIIKFKKQAFWKQYDFSFIITAIIVTLALPATAPLWMPVVGVLVALLVAKHPFGGVGRNIFNPAATGIAFLAISWSDIFFKYPLPLTNFGIDNQQKA